MAYKDIIEEELTTLRDDIIRASEQEGQKASGDTYNEIQIENLTEFSGQLIGPGYIGVLATGRKPGKVPYDFEEIIGEWASTKGIEYSTQEEFEKFVSAVAWKIRREGTKLYREEKGGQLPQIFEIPINDCINRIAKRIAIASSESVVARIDNELKKFYGK